MLRALEAAGMYATASELVAETGFGKDEVSEHLGVLESQGQVRRDGPGWRVTLTEWIAGEAFEYDKPATAINRDAPAWWFPSPFKITGLILGPYKVDAYVRHSITAGDDGQPILDDPPAEIIALTKLVRTDGRELGPDFSFRRAAIEAVIRASRLAIGKQETQGEGSLYVAQSRGWPDHARLIRRLVRLGGRIRWTPELEDWLMATWRHLHETGHGTQADLASELGLHPKVLRERLRMLRRVHGVENVPEGRKGRPASDRNPI